LLLETFNIQFDLMFLVDEMLFTSNDKVENIFK